MAFTVEQARTVAAWRKSGYRIMSQSLVGGGAYLLTIRRPGHPAATVTLRPSGRFSKVESAGGGVIP